MTVTLYHNPRCSKSREALRLLRERGVEPVIIQYLETPPDAATLETLLDALGLEPRDLMRRKEDEYRAAGLDNPRLSRADLIRAMVEHPRVIERPIAVNGDKVALGRPPAQVLEVL
jgi:arsenate reductase